MENPKLRNKYWRSLLLVMHCAITSFSQSAQAEFFTHHWENFQAPQGDLYLNSSLALYGSSAEYNALGSAVAVSNPSANLSSYRRIPLDLEITYGLSSKVTLFGRLSLLRVSYTLENGDNGNQLGFGDQTVGASFAVLKFGRGWTLDLQMQADIPLYNNDKALSETLPFLGDGSLDVTAGFFLSWLINARNDRRLTFDLGMAYTKRGSGFSDHIPFHLGVAFQKLGSQTLHFEFGLRGFFSLNSDSRTSLPSAQQQEDRSGGSDFIGALNPALSQLKLGLGYQLSRRAGLHGEVFFPISGTNAPKGTTFMLSLNYLLKERGPKARDGRPASGIRGALGQKEDDRDADSQINMRISRVASVNDRMQLIKIKIGSRQGVRVGDSFEIYSVYTSGNKRGQRKEKVAKASVSHVRDDEAALKIIDYYQEVLIQRGFVAQQVPK